MVRKSQTPDRDGSFPIPPVRPSIIVGVAFVLTWMIAGFFPESALWGMNHLAFVPSPARWVIGILALLLFMPNLFERAAPTLARMAELVLQPGRSGAIVRTGAALSSILVFYTLSIGTDMYGDTRYIKFSGREFPWSSLFDLRDSEPLTRLIHQTVSRFTGLDLTMTYRILSCIAGGVFVRLLTGWVARLSFDLVGKLTLLVAGLTLGANQLYFGHMENYTLVYSAIWVVLILSWRYFDGEVMLGWILVVFIAGLRLHAEMVLLVPGIIYLILHRLAAKAKVKSRWIGHRTVVAAFAASLVVAAAFYFFYFEAHFVESENQDYLMRKVFLPLINPVPYLNGYTLQSWMHINDFTQLLLMVGLPALVILAVVLWTRGRLIAWKTPRLLFFAICLAYFLVFTFTMNPVLSPPRDWDLLASVAVPLFFFAAALYTQRSPSAGERGLSGIVLPLVVAAGIFSSTLFFVNASRGMADHRLRSLGVWIYQSYHRGSSYLINIGCRSIADLDAQIHERERIIASILPNKMEADPDFSFLYQSLGSTYYQAGDLANAEVNFKRAYAEDGTNSAALKGWGVLALKQGRMSEGIGILDQYNQAYNDPIIQDPDALQVAEYGHYLTFMTDAGADSTELSEVLRSIELSLR